MEIDTGDQQTGPRKGFAHNDDTNKLFLAVGLCVLLYLCIACTMAFPTWAYCGDEGWYSVAARNVARGMKPYRDFFFVQMPFSAYAYGAWFTLWGPSIATGRLLSVLLSVIALVLTMCNCRQRAGYWPAVVAGLLWSTSLYTAGDLSSIKTQALCNALICASIFFVPKPADTDDDLLKGSAASMALMSLAFFTRLTLAIPLVFLWILLAWLWRRRPAAYALLLSVNVAVLLALWAYFWTDGNMWFGIYVSHRDFYGSGPWTWARLGWTIKYSIGNQLVLTGLLLVAVIRFAYSARDTNEWPRLAFPAFLLASYVSVTAAHWAQVQNYPTHQTVISGFAIVFIGIVLGPLIDQLMATSRIQAACAWIGFVLMSLPFSEAGDLLGIATARSETDSLTRAGQVLRQYVKPGDQLLTFNTELAINGGYELYPGCDLSDWGYLAQLPQQLADKYRVLNLRHLQQALKKAETPIVMITDRDFSIMAAGQEDVAKDLKRLIDERYYNVAIVKKYGQFLQDLFIFKRIDSVTEPRP